MSDKDLASYFTLNRRYRRSINLERDLADPNSLSGYVITERAAQTLPRIFESLTRRHNTRAWMLTGVYGTGKSAFAHFLSSLCASSKKEVRKRAEEILKNSRIEKKTLRLCTELLSERGFVQAVATAQREPVTHTIVRALRSGVNSFWDRRQNAYYDFTRKLDAIQKQLVKGNPVSTGEIVSLAGEIADASGTGMILILDELGKCLEYAAQSRGVGDLYMLQQITELASADGPQVYLLGLLHQAFSEYGYGLGKVERNEWVKIQGRFEEIPFTESPMQMTQLIGQVIQREVSRGLNQAISQQASAWHGKLSRVIAIREITSQVLDAGWPLHPVSALTLPQLCIRYAQNDRSLFTFLTSDEPYSLRTFLGEAHVEGDRISLLKLDRLYDYFIDSVGIGLAARQNFQRWTEVKSLIDDHRNGEPDELKALKTIGLLNLASATGFLKASRELVVLALCDAPADRATQSHWQKVVDSLIQRGLVIHRRQVDELRIWEGSDFDVEAAISQYLEQQRSSLAALLTEACPLRPVVAQRHSYKTGTLRFFERRYLDSQAKLNELRCDNKESDGLIAYWVDETPPEPVPPMTADEKPFVLIQTSHTESLRLRVLETMALKNAQANAAELQTDGIARREVRYRLTRAKQMLDEAFVEAVESKASVRCWINGQPESINLRVDLNRRLSELCDTVYRDGLTLLNELVNRQELTSQGAKSSRQVVAAMLEQSELETLGLQGAGPKVSVYHSVLRRTGIHRKVEGEFGFHAPTDPKIKPVWNAVEQFCLSAKDKPASLDRLYHQLKQPPFGVKNGVIPILFAAVILKHADDVSIYKDGNFIPVLGPEHFELFVKNPSRFAVKHYEIHGLRAQVFKEIEDILSNKVGLSQEIRNKTLLGVVTPLLQFVRRLPQYTQRTKQISAQAQAVRQVLLEANEPDKLLFELLPEACGLRPILEDGLQDQTLPRKLRNQLIAALKELREAYEKLLNQCREYIYEAFAIKQGIEHLREHLRVRASFLVGRSIEPALTRFVFAATDDLVEDSQWLKAVAMVISDKPTESWTDNDADAFELKLADVARRFKHLEAIAADNNSAWTNHAEAKRISVIGTDGKELYDVAWIDETQKAHLEKIATEFLQELKLEPAEQRALLAVLTEKVLDTAKSNIPTIQVEATRKIAKR
ncbi:MAG: hypothetical protein SF097_03365 [Acidobacteriota bacterium]|nr:hypothetical protein [Acidobacteriota bacterium]